MIDREDLHSYLDGELSAAEEHAVKEILDKDPSSVAEFHSMQRVKDLLRTRTEPVEYEALWKSCQERLDEVDKTSESSPLLAGTPGGFVPYSSWLLP